LGAINDGAMSVSPAGMIVERYWSQIPGHHPYVTLDKFRVMPNHIHGILHIQKTIHGRDTIHGVSARRERLPGRGFGKVQKTSLSLVLQQYKARVTRECHKNNIRFAWQDNFHDHVIRSEQEYHRIRWYIENNVALWAGDSLNAEKSTEIIFPPEL
jgi:REP element-mobilizing transposase RayT